MRVSKKTPLVALAALAVTVSGGVAVAAAANAAPVTAGGSKSIKTSLGKDGRVSLIQAQQAIKPNTSSTSAQGAAQASIAAYAGKLGVDAKTLAYAKTAKTAAGNTVRFNQNIAGVPVLGGGVAVSQTSAGAMQTINSRTTPLSASSFPAITPRAAAANKTLATKAVSLKLRKESIKASVSGPTRYWFDPAVVGKPGAKHSLVPVASYNVVAQNKNYQVLINIKTRKVELAWATDNHAIKRVICDLNGQAVDTSNNAAYRCDGQAAAFARTEGQGASSIADVNDVYDNFYKTSVAFANYSNVDLTALIGSDYGDGKGKALRATTRVCDSVGGPGACPLDNAYWDGEQMVFGEGVVADDITAHELGHGVTQETSGLFYLWQSGAINESMSDVFGEYTDLTDGSADDTAANAWLIAEGSRIGVIRDMKTPGNYGQPDSMTSPDWTEDAAFNDNGGVHTNSGVGNKAAYLIAAGGSFNGVTVKGLGIAKAWKIYWSTENMLLAGADYKDLFTTLPAACKNLIGKTGTYITADDCTQVTNAVTATRMYSDPTVGAPKNVDYCPAAQPTRNTFQQEGFEASSKWVASPAGSTSEIANNDRVFFQSDTVLMQASGWSGSVVGTGSYMFYPLYEGPSEGTLTQDNSWAIPAATPGSVFLRFDHQYLFDADGETGAELLYSTNNGATWLSAADTLPDVNGSDGNPTELGGNAGFTGMSHGFGAARYDLTGLKGQTVKFRFHAKSTNSFDVWWIDNVRLFSCV